MEPNSKIQDPKTLLHKLNLLLFQPIKIILQDPIVYVLCNEACWMDAETKLSA